MYGIDQYLLQWNEEIGLLWTKEGLDRYLKLSYPFTHADRITTPTLFMVGENDFNVPAAGTEQMYAALKTLNVPTTLVIYPNQFHGLFATSSFIKLNRGWLSLISGNKKLNVSKNQTIVKDIDYWQGTCVYIRINTNVEVDYTEFTSPNYDYKKQLFKDMFG